MSMIPTLSIPTEAKQAFQNETIDRARYLLFPFLYTAPESLHLDEDSTQVYYNWLEKIRLQVPAAQIQHRYEDLQAHELFYRMVVGAFQDPKQGEDVPSEMCMVGSADLIPLLNRACELNLPALESQCLIGFNTLQFPPPAQVPTRPYLKGLADRKFELITTADGCLNIRTRGWWSYLSNESANLAYGIGRWARTAVLSAYYSNPR
ncbi:MAG: hypothetical protein KDK78_09010 [Chlamydiia bacterium]|nr:hypothetical protein [Chlamydiia bacterium]